MYNGYYVYRYIYYYTMYIALSGKILYIWLVYREGINLLYVILYVCVQVYHSSLLFIYYYVYRYIRKVYTKHMKMAVDTISSVRELVRLRENEMNSKLNLSVSTLNSNVLRWGNKRAISRYIRCYNYCCCGTLLQIKGIYLMLLEFCVLCLKKLQNIILVTPEYPRYISCCIKFKH